MTRPAAPCPWEHIGQFLDRAEFDRCAQWLEQQVRAGTAHEVPAAAHYLGANTLEEHWYRHVASGEVWRLVWPDPPFRGLFARVG